MAMKHQITDKLASSLAWHGQPYFAWDTECAGFGVRVHGDGARAYVVQVKHAGRQYREVLGRVGETKAKDAREAAIAFKGRVRGGQDPRAGEKALAAAWTLADAMTYFSGAHAQVRKLSGKHLTDSEHRWEHHTPDRWKAMKLPDISQGMVATRHSEITLGAPAGANRWLALMSKLFELGIVQGHCVLNPAKGIKRNEEVQRDRFLNPRELTTLWRYLEAHPAAAVRSGSPGCRCVRPGPEPG